MLREEKHREEMKRKKSRSGLSGDKLNDHVVYHESKSKLI